MCESGHTRCAKQVARMVADLRQGKPTERWRRKVSGLKSLGLHDSGTAEIQSPFGLPRCWRRCVVPQVERGGYDWTFPDRERARTLNVLNAPASIGASLRPQRRSVRCTYGDVRVNSQSPSVNDR